MRMFPCYKEILKKKKKKKRSLSHHRTTHEFFKPFTGTYESPPVLMDIADDNPDDTPTVQEEVLPP